MIINHNFTIKLGEKTKTIVINLINKQTLKVFFVEKKYNYVFSAYKIIYKIKHLYIYIKIFKNLKQIMFVIKSLYIIMSTHLY